MLDMITRRVNNYSYQVILQDNLQQLSNFIIEEKKEFEFIIPKMKLNRNDNVKLRETVLGLLLKKETVKSIYSYHHQNIRQKFLIYSTHN